MTLHDSYLGAYASVTDRSKDWYVFNWEKCQTCQKDIDCNPLCEALRKIPGDISDFVFEPGSSSGFVRFPPKAMIQNIARIVRNNGGKIIANEVTTGVGRTGLWFGFQHYAPLGIDGVLQRDWRADAPAHLPCGHQFPNVTYRPPQLRETEIIRLRLHDQFLRGRRKACHPTQLHRIGILRAQGIVELWKGMLNTAKQGQRGYEYYQQTANRTRHDYSSLVAVRVSLPYMSERSASSAAASRLLEPVVS